MKTDVVKLTKDLVNIDSDSTNTGEKRVASYINEYLGNLGIDSELIEFSKGRCNVIAKIGDQNGLMLNGHTDTVPIGDVKKWKYGSEAKIVNNKLYGRGSSDMKGGIAAILAALQNANLKKPKRQLILAFVADEEVDLLGSRWLLKNREALFRNVRYGIFAEPTDMRVNIAQKGYVDTDVTIIGKSAHGSRPWLGRNAIVDAAKFIEKLGVLSKNLKTEDKILGKGTINIGKITGGTARNVVADSCTIQIDRRIVPGETKEIALTQIKRILDTLKLDYRAEIKVSTLPYRLDRDSYIVRFMMEIGNFEIGSSPGYTEAELYNRIAGIDSVIFGPGNRETIHKPNEYVSIESLKKGERYFSRIISKWYTGS